MNFENVERYRLAAELFNEATKLSPIEMYEAIGHPLPSRLASNVTFYTIEQVPGVEYGDDAARLLEKGVDNIGSALNFDLKTQPSLEAARNFILHERTIRALGQFARLKNQEMDDEIGAALDALSSERQRAYRAPGFEPASYLVTPRQYDKPSDPDRGCPVAKRGGGTEHTPIFDKAVIWTGLLSLRALAHHGIPGHFSLEDADDNLFSMP